MTLREEAPATAARGGSGSRGLGRLAAGLGVAAAGGIVTAFATRLVWVRADVPGRVTEAPGGGPLIVGERAVSWTGGDLAPEVVALAVGVTALALLGVLVGRRARVALAALALAGAAAAVAFTVPAASPPEPSAGEVRAPARAAGWWTALAGATLAAAGAGGALTAAGRVRRLGLPEVPGEELP